MYRSISDFTDGGYRVETALWSPASSTFVGRPCLPGSAPKYSFEATHTSGGNSLGLDVDVSGLAAVVRTPLLQVKPPGEAVSRPE